MNSELPRLETLLELLDLLDIAYFKVDVAGYTLESSPADCRITGYSPEELQSLRRDELYPDPGRRERLLGSLRSRGGRLVRELLQLRRKSGEICWVEGDIRLLTDGAGNEVGVEGLYRDVTDRIKLQRFLARDEGPNYLLADDELFSRLREQAEFQLDYISSIGHQIQTPLSGLVGTLENFQKGLLSQGELLSRLPWVIGQTRVCALLVRNLSYMEQILRGESFTKLSVSLAKLIIETKLDFQQQLLEKRLELQIDDHSLDRHVRVSGHPELLRQVLVNLVDNAIKYSIEGSVIHARGHYWRDGRVLEISNRGISIPSESRERIFQMGFRESRARALVPHGTGLGLWLVRKILEAHDAKILCTEEIQGGEKRVIFRITFPHPTSSRQGRRHP